MAYHQTFWPVAPALRDLVDHIWVMRCDMGELDAAAGALLPQFMWQLTGQLGWRPRGGAEHLCFPASLLGPTAGSHRMTADGLTTVLGVGVYPEGWQTFVPASADQLVGKLVDLQQVWGADALEPLAGRPEEPDVALAARVEALLLRRLATAEPFDARVAVISRWINGPARNIEDLANALGVSERQLARIARRAHGLPPRLLANKHRVLKAAVMIAAGAADSKDAWTEDFADQSHFIREFRRFMGITPAAFLKEDGWLVRGVMASRAQIASPHPLGLA